jgi:hypothetical protein
VLALAASAATCGRWPLERGWVSARVTRAPKDTIRFEARARASRCVGPGKGGLLVQGASGQSGVIVWLRYPYADSLKSGDWPLVQRGDTVAARGAVVGARFLVTDLAHGVALDSGAVRVSRAGRDLTIVVRGSGLEAVGASRAGLDATFNAVPIGDDTVTCRAEP